MVKILKNKIILIFILLIIFFVTTVLFLRSRNLTKEETKISSDLNKNNEDIDDSDKDIIDSLSNKIINNKYENLVKDNSIYIEDLQARNNAIAEEYGKAVRLFNDFAKENSLTLTYVEPIEDRISRFKGVNEDQVSVLLQKLFDLGAETVNYFTNEDGLNIDGSFKFSTSKLNEFRNMLTNDNSLNYDLVDNYISKVISGEYSKDSAYLNKIDNNIYETIIVNKNTCYYKMVYNPLL